TGGPGQQVAYTRTTRSSGPRRHGPLRQTPVAWSAPPQAQTRVLDASCRDLLSSGIRTECRCWFSTFLSPSAQTDVALEPLLPSPSPLGHLLSAGETCHLFLCQLRPVGRFLRGCTRQGLVGDKTDRSIAQHGEQQVVGGSGDHGEPMAGQPVLSPETRVGAAMEAARVSYRD